MFPTRFPQRAYGLRAIATFLALSFTLPSPALALRTEQRENEAGLEEVKVALQGPSQMPNVSSTASLASPRMSPPLNPSTTAGLEENLLLHEAVDMVMARVKEGTVGSIQRGKVILEGPDLTKGKIEAEARLLAEPNGGWLRVKFKENVAILLPAVPAAGLEEIRRALADSARTTPAVASASVRSSAAGLEEVDKFLNELGGLSRQAVNAGEQRDDWELQHLEDQALESFQHLTIMNQEELSQSPHYLQTLVDLQLAFPTKFFLGNRREPLGIIKLSRDALDDENVGPETIGGLLANRQTSLDKKAFNRLAMGGAVAVKPWRSLRALLGLQKKTPRSELTFDCFPSEERSIVVLAQELEQQAIPRFKFSAPYKGHTHHFIVPIEASNADTKMAKMLSDGRNITAFILAFGDDGHAELAVFSPSTRTWNYERRDQKIITKQLKQFGLLYSSERSVHEKTGLEEKGTPEVGRAALRTFLAMVGEATMKGLSPFDSAHPVISLTDSFPLLKELAEGAGYAHGVAELIWFSQLPSVPLTSTRNVFVQKGVSWSRQVEQNLTGYVNFVAAPESADLIIGEDGMEVRVGRDQAFLQVNAETAKAVTPGLLKHLEKQHLLNPGSIVVLDILLERMEDKVEVVRLFA